ncbi:MAG: hypothetical protein BWK79_16190 [Beggiatoa sp. IS2]|nr:MAG: hypothetical protein BWK79_16190 [Beggiatoa sp. IS2]
MKKSQFYSILLLCFISIGALAYWFLQNFERVSEYKEMGYQGQARYNFLLAAQRLLERSGTKTQTVYSFSRIAAQLTPQDTIVLLAYNDSYLTGQQQQQLLNWVRAGGHLIVTGSIIGEENEENELFNQIGVSIEENDLDCADCDNIEQRPLTFFTWNRHSLHIAFDPQFFLESNRSPDLSIDSDYGYHLFMYKIGQGYLTMLSDLQFLHNDEIGKYDHAAFLWYLVHYQRSVTQTWLLVLRNTDIPSLATLLWQHAQPLVISSLFLLMLTLWSISRRFGPLLPSPPRTRRRLLEHLDASGRFLWRYEQSHLLLTTVRQAVFKRLEQIYPTWGTLPQTELCQRLARLGKLSPQQVESALYQMQFKSEMSFTQAVQTLTTIKEKL